MIERIDHVALAVTDLQRSIRFYEDVVGMELYAKHQATTGMDIAYLRLGGTVLELMHVPQAAPVEQVGAPRAGTNHFALLVRDFAAEVARWKSLGVPVDREPHETYARTPEEEGFRRCTFRGPDGEIIELRGK